VARTAITLKGVTKQFGRICALDNVSLDIHEGSFVSLVGPSGCGKTTILRIVAGLEHTTAGEVKIFANSPLLARQKHDLGVAFQRPALIPNRTALQNVRLTNEITKGNNGLSPEKLLMDFGLGQFQEHYPHQLSGGMQQRVNIACAVAHNPRVLLLDEPFGALDELTRESMMDWLGGVLAHNPKTVLFVTHNVEEAIFLSDYVVVLSPRPGQIHAQFCIDFPRPRTRELRVSQEFLSCLGEVRQSLYQIVNGD
jgi:NitT/TauT family transport system ATP-binding protein